MEKESEYNWRERLIEKGKEIVERVDAETNAQDFIDVVRKRNEKDLGSGLGEDTISSKGIAEALPIATKIDEVNDFYRNFSSLVRRHPELEGKTLIDLLSHGKNPLRVRRLLSKGVEDLVKDIDWGRYLLKIRDYLSRKFPEAGIRREEVKGPEGKIEIEIDDFFNSD